MAKKKTTPSEFFRQVKQEGQKITWPTRRETLISTIMVIIMVIILSLFLFLADQVFATLVRWFLSLGI